MGLFEDAVVKAKDAFDVAAKKTNEVVETQKLKLKVSQLKSQISKEFETLGRVYYDGIKNDLDVSGQASEVVKSIDEKHDEVSALELEIDSQKKVVTCDVCGYKNANEAVFCSGCGEKIK